jgi:hypothetical protein
VRDEHAAINGVTLPPSDPFWKKYYPPNGWGCRCTVAQVRKGKYKQSDPRKAMAAGDFATKNPKQQIFRFNAGTGKKVFPNKHPYFPKGCEGCDVKLQLVGKGKAWCKACVAIQKQAKRQQATDNTKIYETVPTEKGVVRVSKAHNKNEKADNIVIAKYYANKKGHEIDLLPILQNQPSPDAFNKTLNIHQEYKTNKKPSKGAIDNELRSAGRQSGNIVLHIQSEITDELLVRGIKGRVNQKQNIETVSVIKNGKDKTYTREQILKKDFAL